MKLNALFQAHRAIKSRSKLSFPIKVAILSTFYSEVSAVDGNKMAFHLGKPHGPEPKLWKQFTSRRASEYVWNVFRGNLPALVSHKAFLPRGPDCHSGTPFLWLRWQTHHASLRVLCLGVKEELWMVGVISYRVRPEGRPSEMGRMSFLMNGPRKLDLPLSICYHLGLCLEQALEAPSDSIVL